MNELFESVQYFGFVELFINGLWTYEPQFYPLAADSLDQCKELAQQVVDKVSTIIEDNADVRLTCVEVTAMVSDAVLGAINLAGEEI